MPDPQDMPQSFTWPTAVNAPTDDMIANIYKSGIAQKGSMPMYPNLASWQAQMGGLSGDPTPNPSPNDKAKLWRYNFALSPFSPEVMHFVCVNPAKKVDLTTNGFSDEVTMAVVGLAQHFYRTNLKYFAVIPGFEIKTYTRAQAANFNFKASPMSLSEPYPVGMLVQDETNWAIEYAGAKWRVAYNSQYAVQFNADGGVGFFQWAKWVRPAELVIPAGPKLSDDEVIALATGILAGLEANAIPKAQGAQALRNL